MKSTGIRRKIDKLGRVVVPKEIREKYELKNGQDVDFFVHNDYVALKSYIPGCVFCHSTKDTKEIKGKTICSKCLKELSKL